MKFPGKQEVAVPDWDERRVGDQTGRTVVVTGANSGIGLHTARVLAARGAQVVLACRDAGRGEQVRRGMGAGARVAQLDLADLDSVARFADGLGVDRLDGLVCNAGVMGGRFGLSAQGYERQMATNHLGHFALTARLWPVLCAAGQARVVVVSSLAARRGSLGRDLGRDTLVAPVPYRANAVYSNTKQANLLFALELHRRATAAGSPVRAVAVHPGVAATNLAPRELRESGFGVAVPLARLLQPLFMQSAQAGALPTLRALCDPQIEGGAFVGPARWSGARGAPRVIPPFETGTDPVTAARLWACSEELVALPFAVG